MFWRNNFGTLAIFTAIRRVSSHSPRLLAGHHDRLGALANCSIALRSNAGSVHCIKHKDPDQRDKSERHKRGERHDKEDGERERDSVHNPTTGVTYAAFTPLESIERSAFCRLTLEWPEIGSNQSQRAPGIRAKTQRGQGLFRIAQIYIEPHFVERKSLM